MVGARSPPDRPPLNSQGRPTAGPDETGQILSGSKIVDLIIRNARLFDRLSDGPLDIGVEQGRIIAIERGISSEADVYDAKGYLVCPGLIETHIHLDKSRIIDRCAPQERSQLSPVKGVTPLKKSMSVEDVRTRAERTLEECIKHGTTRMRTQVEVDPGIGMRGFEGVQSLIADYRWAIDIEICVFPQEGLISYPGTEELLIEGLKRGARVIGGAPRYDTEEAGQIHRIFELACEFDVDIDMHLDVGPTPDAMNIHLVRELTDKYQRGGRVVVGHMAKLSLMPPDEVAALARSLADTGVAVTVLPTTDLFLMGRNRDHSVVRGVADANLHANVLQVDRPGELRECFGMLTDMSARLLNLKDYGFAVGNPADVVVIGAQEPEQVIAEISQPLAVFKNGKRTVVWHPPELLRPHHVLDLQH
jgi:cytosine/creatinine deaminase